MGRLIYTPFYYPSCSFLFFSISEEAASIWRGFERSILILIIIIIINHNEDENETRRKRDQTRPDEIRRNDTAYDMTAFPLLSEKVVRHRCHYFCFFHSISSLSILNCQLFQYRKTVFILPSCTFYSIFVFSSLQPMLQLPLYSK